MEPRSAPGEQLPQISQPEQWTVPTSPERAPSSPEQHEVPRPVIEQPAAAQQAEKSHQPVAAGSASLPAPQTDDTTTLPTDDDTPLVAADEDVIEKEWVDKAKKILIETKDDPYLREQQIKKLQVEYIRKRYGREIGETVD